MHKKNRNPIFMAIAFTVLIAIISILLTLVFKSSTREVEVLVAPASATVTIDGKTYDNGIHNLPAKEVSVHIEKPGFVSQDFTFNTTTNDKLYAFLLQKDGTFSWYETHHDDDIIMTTIGDYLNSNTANQYIKSYPEIEKLPIIYAAYDGNYDYTEFRIDGGKFEKCSSDFCLKVTDTTGGNFEFAKQLLKEKGIDPEKYELLYEYVPIIPLD